MAKKKDTEGKKEIRFLLSPTGVFGLGYSAGDTAVLDEGRAGELVEAGYARYTDDAENAATETADVKALQAENAELKKGVTAYGNEIESLKKVIQDKDAEIAELVEALKNSNLAVDNLKAAYAVNTAPGEDKK